MLKRAEEMVVELKEKMRGGNGVVTLQHIFTEDELTGKARIFAKITLNTGCSIGKHNHVTEEEIYYIIKGSGVVTDNDDTYTVNVGDAVLTGNGSFHSIENKGAEPLELVAVILLFV